MTFDVLLADDSRVMRAMILRTLRLTRLPLGQVHEVGDGAAALEVCARHRLDVALIDINMPVLDGLEVVTRLRAQEAGRKLPILVISTESSSTRIAELQRLGAGFVHKPFTPEQLSRALREITGYDDEHGTGPGAAAGFGADF